MRQHRRQWSANCRPLKRFDLLMMAGQANDFVPFENLRGRKVFESKVCNM